MDKDTSQECPVKTIINPFYQEFIEKMLHI